MGKFCFVAGVTRRRRKTTPPSTTSKAGSNGVLVNVVPGSQETQAGGVPDNASSPSRLAIEYEPSKSDPQQPGQQLSLLAGKSSIASELLTQVYQQPNLRTDLALEGLKPGISELLMNCKL